MNLFNESYFDKYKETLLENALVYAIETKNKRYLNFIKENLSKIKEMTSSEFSFKLKTTELAFKNISSKSFIKNDYFEINPNLNKKTIEKNKELFTGLDITIVAPCKWLAELLKGSFLGAYPTEVIYNGIDTTVFKPTESNFKKKYGIEYKKIILGVAGEWTERKGLRDFAKLNEILDKESYAIVVVGVTKEQANDLSKDIIAINRTDNVHELVEYCVEWWLDKEKKREIQMLKC